MLRVAALALCLALPACVAGEQIVQTSAQSLARGAVNSAAARYLPGVPVTPFTDCVINNAETAELIALARHASAGAEGAVEAWPVVQKIALRPEASRCLMQSLSTTEVISLGGLML